MYLTSDDTSEYMYMYQQCMGVYIFLVMACTFLFQTLYFLVTFFFFWESFTTWFQVSLVMYFYLSSKLAPDLMNMCIIIVIYEINQW